MAKYLGARPPLAEKRRSAHIILSTKNNNTLSSIIINVRRFSLLNHNNKASGDQDESKSVKLWHQCPKRRMLLLPSTCSNRDGDASTTTEQKEEAHHALQQIEQTLDLNKTVLWNALDALWERADRFDLDDRGVFETHTVCRSCQTRRIGSLWFK